MQIRQSDCDLITVAQMRAAEAHAMEAGTSGKRLMERAGRATADLVSSLLLEERGEAQGADVHVLCGPGNNGGDGYVIARVLAGRGHNVTVYGLVPRASLQGDARLMAELWQGVVHPPERFCELQVTTPDRSTLIVDALFGTGLARPLDGIAARMVRHANGLPALRAAVDIPSGIAGDTGDVLGVAFSADLTVTFHARKPGHVLPPGRWASGEVVIADIGLGDQATELARLSTDGPDLFINDAAALLTDLGSDPSGHKYTKGHCLVFAGGLEGTGAARLSARAALRAGAGLVTLGVPPSALIAHVSRGPDALMVRRCDGLEGVASLLADKRRNAVVIGPAYGIGAATRDAVNAVIQSGRPCVLDADALTSFADDAAALVALAAQAGNTVWTPHDGEFARLFASAVGHQPETAEKRDKTVRKNPLSAAILSSESRLNRALEAAALASAVIVLKGPSTVIAAPDGRCAINTNAPQWLGTAGSGDVLAGIIGGLLSQGLSPFDAARAGVWLHGEAGQIAGRGLIADDLPEALRQVIKGI